MGAQTFLQEKGPRPIGELAISTLGQGTLHAIELSFTPSDIDSSRHNFIQCAVDVHSLVQAKLTVGTVGDEFEQEANRVAEEVMISAPSLSNSEDNTQSGVAAPGQIQRKVVSNPDSSPALDSGLKLSRASGISLLSSTKLFMESRFGVDFSRIRIHTDTSSEKINNDLNALAFTHGSDIYFNKGQYQPDSNRLQQAGTVDEVKYELYVEVQGKKEIESKFSEEVKKAVMTRYYGLAGTNNTHFTNLSSREFNRSFINKTRQKTETGTPKNNAGSYRFNHDPAVDMAVAASQLGDSFDTALVYEGFASHFLTDSYSAGHVRVAR